MLQLARRVGLALGMILAVLAWSWVDTGPFVTVSLPQGGRHAPEVTRGVSARAGRHCMPICWLWSAVR